MLAGFLTIRWQDRIPAGLAYPLLYKFRTAKPLCHFNQGSIMKIHSLVTSLLLLSATSFAGTITNGDFATGNLNGWTATPNVSIRPNGSGGYLADLWSGLGKETYTTLTQQIYLNAGDTLNGWAKWLGHDYLPYNDDAFVSLGTTRLMSANIAQYGNYGSSPVLSFSFTAATSDWYVLAAGVRDIGDHLLPSELKVGGFVITSHSAPEPATLALLGLGLGLATLCLRRRDNEQG